MAATLSYGVVVITDEELTALALAANPHVLVPADAVPFRDGRADEGLLPSWYFPSPAAGPRRVRGWRRRVVMLLVIAFVLVSASGLCCTYGALVMA